MICLSKNHLGSTPIPLIFNASILWSQIFVGFIPPTSTMVSGGCLFYEWGKEVCITIPLHPIAIPLNHHSITIESHFSGMIPPSYEKIVIYPINPH